MTNTLNTSVNPSNNISNIDELNTSLQQILLTNGVLFTDRHKSCVSYKTLPDKIRPLDFKNKTKMSCGDKTSCPVCRYKFMSTPTGPCRRGPASPGCPRSSRAAIRSWVRSPKRCSASSWALLAPLRGQILKYFDPLRASPLNILGSDPTPPPTHSKVPRDPCVPRYRNI